MQFSRTILTLLAALAIAVPQLVIAQDLAEQPVSEKFELSEMEQGFSDLLTNSVMVGQFTIEGRPNPKPREERYTIEKVTKTGPQDWIVQSRITYGDYDVPVPVPVQVLWAGDTPVLQVTDLKIPLLGEGFTARVMFYADRYAGTWYHGEKVGGHMWGMIERHVAKPQPEASEKTPTENSENN